MAGPGRFTGNPSQRSSGVSDLRTLQELIIKVQEIESSYLKLSKLLAGLTSTVIIQQGKVELEWPGASPQSIESDVKFPEESKGGLINIQVTPWNVTGDIFIAEIQTVNAKGFKVFGYNPAGSPPAGKKENVYWLALTD
jgi:hypothetical protein